MDYLKNCKESHEFSKKVLEAMSEHNAPASPQNYEIWFTYLSGRNPKLNQTIEILFSNKREFTADISDEIYHQHFESSSSKITDDMMNVGVRMKTELDGLIESVESSLKNTSAYGDTLQAASGELSEPQNQSDVKLYLDKIVSATRQMEKHNETLESRLQESAREVNTLRHNIEEIRHESLTDQLTSLSNRKAFDNTLRDSAAEAMEDGEDLCLLFSDIDHFKKFNDTWGHQTGDNVLRLVAKCLSTNVKGRDTAARYGGEEFAVILPQTSLPNAIKLADQIRTSVQAKELQKRSTGEKLGTITISIGVSRFRPGETLNEFVHRADACLYAAKNNGRNCVISESDEAMAHFDDLKDSIA